MPLAVEKRRKRDSKEEVTFGESREGVSGDLLFNRARIPQAKDE